LKQGSAANGVKRGRRRRGKRRTPDARRHSSGSACDSAYDSGGAASRGNRVERARLACSAACPGVRQRAFSVNVGF
jgi:hypothetical protein